jgi:hypothetical protein
MNRSRIRSPWPQRPLELNPYPMTHFPSRTTSVTTATKLEVILLKSTSAFRIGELIGNAFADSGDLHANLATAAILPRCHAPRPPGSPVGMRFINAPA